MITSALRTKNDSRDIRRCSDARERFLSEPSADLAGVRPVIARSWFRSKAAGVDAVADHGRLDDGRVDEHTLAAAAPFLSNLDDIAADMGGYVSITAPNGTLVHPGFLREMDSFPAGYSLLEDSCGSNGEGLALEEGRGVWLAPEEHFREDMRSNWCFASLVRDPFHNRVRAVVGLTFPGDRVAGIEPPSTMLMLEGIVSRIEMEIGERTSSRERQLLSEYLRAIRRRGSAAIIALDGKNSFMNAKATDSLQDSDFSIISGYAKAVMTSGHELSCEVRLAGAGPATLEVSPAGLAGSSPGAIVVVRQHAEAGTHDDLDAAPHPAIPKSPIEVALRKRLDGVSGEFERMVDLAARAVQHRKSVAIIGEAGSGKTRLAEAIAEFGTVTVIDAARRHSDEDSVQEAILKSSVAAAECLLVKHADVLSPVEAAEITRLRAGQAVSPRLLITFTRPTESTLALSEAFDALEIRTSPLRNRREDIPELVVALAGEFGKRPNRRLIATLTNTDWARNIDQLRAVVSNAAERSRGPEITPDDLPQGFHQVLTNGRLSRLEDAEFSELRTALQEANGNRRRAAEILQIGRSTLYRRMDFFRTRGFDV